MQQSVFGVLVGVGTTLEVGVGNGPHQHASMHCTLLAICTHRGSQLLVQQKSSAAQTQVTQSITWQPVPSWTEQQLLGVRVALGTNVTVGVRVSGPGVSVTVTVKVRDGVSVTVLVGVVVGVRRGGVAVNVNTEVGVLLGPVGVSVGVSVMVGVFVSRGVGGDGGGVGRSRGTLTSTPPSLPQPAINVAPAPSTNPTDANAHHARQNRRIP